MTGTHLDLDRLADLLAGEGTDDDVAHVGACAGCAGRLDELAAAEVEVAAVLAQLPQPAVPPSLAARLDAAIAAEPPLEPAAATGGAGAAQDEDDDRRAAARTVTPLAGRRRSRAPLAAAAALLVAAGVVGGGIALSASRSQDDASTSTAAGGGAGASEAGGVPSSSTGTDYAAAGSLQAALPGLLSSSATAADTAARGSAPSSTSGAAAPQSALGGDPLARLRRPDELAGCLSAVLPPGGDVQPLALDYAAYAGQPALVVVLPATGDTAKVDVFVVGAECRRGDDRTLFFSRLDRPAR